MAEQKRSLTYALVLLVSMSCVLEVVSMEEPNLILIQSTAGGEATFICDVDGRADNFKLYKNGENILTTVNDPTLTTSTGSSGDTAEYTCKYETNGIWSEASNVIEA